VTSLSAVDLAMLLAVDFAHHVVVNPASLRVTRGVLHTAYGGLI